MANKRNADTNSVIKVDNFTMRFGKNIVIDKLSFEVKKGETFGFLGSNGSGKTTTMRALLGVYTPTDGSLTINGNKFTPENGKDVGYLPEERGLYKKEHVIDVMVYFGQLKGLSRDEAYKWSIDYLNKVKLQDKAKTNIDKLSGGQQQKIQLGVTMMNDPSILILDEPTKGFDPVNRKLLMSLIDEQKDKGATIIMITHDMSEVERLCDRLILLKNGNKEAYGSVPDVLKKFNKDTMDQVFLHVYGEDALLEGGEL